MISIVDDDESIRAATKALLRSVGYEVETFASAELFLASGALRQTECLVLDVRMPGINGLELQRRLNEAKSGVPIVFVTAHDDRAHRNKAMEAGAANFFRKPFDANAFVAAIRMALGRGRSFAAQSVEHREISGYGTPQSLARQIGERDAATLLAHTLGEEEFGLSTNRTYKAADAEGQLQRSRGGEQNRQCEKADGLNRANGGLHVPPY